MPHEAAVLNPLLVGVFLDLLSYWGLRSWNTLYAEGKNKLTMESWNGLSCDTTSRAFDLNTAHTDQWVNSAYSCIWSWMNVIPSLSRTQITRADRAAKKCGYVNCAPRSRQQACITTWRWPLVLLRSVVMLLCPSKQACITGWRWPMVNMPKF
jgi:hypothetical protein